MTPNLRLNFYLIKMKQDRHTNCHIISITLDPNFSFFPLFFFLFPRCLSLLLSFLGDTLTDPSLFINTRIYYPLSSLSFPLAPRLFGLFAIMAPLSLSLFVLASFLPCVIALPTLIYFLSLGQGAYCNPRLFVLLLRAEPALAVLSAAKPVIPNDRC
jgi:hypothetical protein